MHHEGTTDRGDTVMSWQAARVDDTWYVVNDDEGGMSLVDRATLTLTLQEFFTGRKPNGEPTPRVGDSPVE
jgi:hypothetical protein